MITFLPYADYNESALVLDRARLGKQRSECKTMLNGGWANHPASRMWYRHHYELCTYSIAICTEWIRRGYRDSLLDYFKAFKEDCDATSGKPSWLGDERIHSSHRANLLRKNIEHYGQFGWAESPIKGYFWPLGKDYK